MKLQLSFYQLPFTSLSQTVTTLGAFLLFTTLGHSSLPQMQQLLWVVQSLRLLLGLDWILETWQNLWESCCGWMNWRWVTRMCVRGVCIFQYVCRFLTTSMEATHATHLTINLYTCISSLHLMMHSSTKNILGTQPRCVSWNFSIQGMHSVLSITETKLLFFTSNQHLTYIMCVTSCML